MSKLLGYIQLRLTSWQLWVCGKGVATIDGLKSSWLCTGAKSTHPWQVCEPWFWVHCCKIHLGTDALLGANQGITIRTLSFLRPLSDSW